MAKKITAEQFEALRPWSEGLIEQEKDGAYGYERFLNEDGCMVASAAYGPGCGPDFEQHEPPMPRAIYDEDGNQIAAGF